MGLEYLKKDSGNVLVFTWKWDDSGGSMDVLNRKPVSEKTEPPPTRTVSHQNSHQLNNHQNHSYSTVISSASASSTTNHHNHVNSASSGSSNKYLHKKFKRVIDTPAEVVPSNQTTITELNAATLSRIAAPTTTTSSPTKSFHQNVTNVVYRHKSTNNYSQAPESQSQKQQQQPQKLFTSANTLKTINNNNNNTNSNNNNQQKNLYNSSLPRTSILVDQPLIALTHVPSDRHHFEILANVQKLEPREVQQIFTPNNYSFLPNNFQQIRNGTPPQQQLRPGSPYVHVQDRTAYVVTGQSDREYTDGQSTPGKHVCPYCQLVCTKPSVLEKHIRAHTNERPFPCTLCGFAFKTKSNLHKHFKSRAHTSRERGEDPQGEDDGSFLGSDSEATDKDTSNSGLDMVRRVSPVEERTSSPSSQQSTDRPYKPKFHLSVKNDPVKQPLKVTNQMQIFKMSEGPLMPSYVDPVPVVATNSVSYTHATNHISSLSNTTNTITTSSHAKLALTENIEQRIQKLISDNSAIVEGIEPPLQKKYHKICGLSRQLSMENTTNSLTTPVTSSIRRSQHRDIQPVSIPVVSANANSNVVIVTPRTPQYAPQNLTQVQPQAQPAHQPLNLTKSADVAPPDEPPPGIRKGQSHLELPQEVLTVLDHPQNPERSIIKDLLLNSKQFGVVEAEGEGSYPCKMCGTYYQTMDAYKYHKAVHCGGNSPRSAPISPAASPHPYVRSNSVSQPPLERMKTSNDKKTIKLQQTRYLKKPENIIISQQIPSMSPVIEAAGNYDWKIDTPLPSPGPLLGNTRLVNPRLDDAPRMERKLSLQQDHEQIEMKRPRFHSVDLQRTPERTPEKLHMYGGQVHIFDKGNHEERINRYTSGGTMSSISPDDDSDAPVIIRTGLSSGGMAVQRPPERAENPYLPHTPKLVLTITPTLSLSKSTQSALRNSQTSHFQFPTNNSDNVMLNYSMLPLPPGPPGQAASIMHGGKIIPYVPGIPGPNTMNAKVENTSKKISPKLLVQEHQFVQPSHSPRTIKVELDDYNKPKKHSNGIWPPQKTDKFNFAKMAENVSSPRKEEENYENLIAKNEIIVRPIEKPTEIKEEGKQTEKFIRPTTLPLKPGTFTPKQHHGITPTQNTMPLISPETPRISKQCQQMFLNGHSYTFLGLKCSTRSFYCTVTKPQPTHFQARREEEKKVSMYSHWQVYPERDPHPLMEKSSSSKIMALYDSRQHKNSKYTIAGPKKEESTVVYVRTTPQSFYDILSLQSLRPPEEVIEAQEVYVRGRGRGKYICEECGIRCKKPSMLKKHIRTHTDVRPYTCTHCNFSFKTKGNLTKHMKSKAHYKKCIELGIPVEEYTGADCDMDGDQLSVSGSERHSINTGDNDDSENDSDGDGDETESDIEENKTRKQEQDEQEAARCLLTLSMTPPAPATAKSSIMFPKEKFTEQRQPLEHDNRQIITFAPPKQFDLHNQYYSDPKTAKVKPHEQDLNDAPIDLTKKPVSDVVKPISGVGLLASLVSINDRVPGNNMNEEFDHEILPHKYITDRAMQDTKMKRFQMNAMPYASPPIEDKKEDDIDGPSRMETLAEIAASSMKLDVAKPRYEEENSGAKNVATVYLQLTSKKQREEGGSSSEDQEPITEKFPSDIGPRTVVVGGDGFKKSAHRPEVQQPAFTDGKPVCNICHKTFQKASQLQIHKNIHYMERKHRCEPCAVSFRTHGHLVKHKNSQQHQSKVNMTATFGVPSQSNPRPFKCKECKSAFRIHGHLAKHLRSKLHILKLECMQKLPFNTYAEIERQGFNLTNIDTSDCDSSLASLREIARKLHEKDPTKLTLVNMEQGASVERESDTDMVEDGDSDGNLDDETLENIQNEPDNGLKRKLSEIENSLGNSPLREEKLNGDFTTMLPPSPRISPLQSMQRMSPMMNTDSDENAEKKFKMSVPVVSSAPNDT